MTWLLRMRVVLAIALGGLILGGCSSSDSSTPTVDASSSTPSTSPSTSPSTTPAAAATCRVKGYVPRSTIVLRRLRPVVVYAHRLGVAPTSTVRSPGLDLVGLDLVPLKVRSDHPPARLTAEDRRQILASAAGPVEDGRIADTVYGPVRVENDTSRNQDYLVYRGSFVHSGDWRLRVCGAPYNDGTEIETLTGTYSTVSRIRPVRVARCGAPASDSELDRYAARRACDDL